MTIYFSVDVETTGPCPGKGELLSIGICTLGTKYQESLYQVIEHKVLHCDADTIAWWMLQERNRWLEATEEGEPEHKVAHNLEDFIVTCAPDSKTRCFVANPVAFDWPWINDLFLRQLGRNPFGHRALCIRSMAYGMTKHEWGVEREEWGQLQVLPDIPHNALSDAIAQAKELEILLSKKINLFTD